MEIFAIFLDNIKIGTFTLDDALDYEEKIKTQNPNANLEIIELATSSI